MSLGEVDGTVSEGKELSGKQSLMLRRLSRALSLFQLFLDEVYVLGVIFNENLNSCHIIFFWEIHVQKLVKSLNGFHEFFKITKNTNFFNVFNENINFFKIQSIYLKKLNLVACKA